jgi:D-alanyl-D-alanine carboxypeptidase
MRPRNITTKHHVARIYSVRALALVLALSLTAVASVAASAVEAIDTASSYQVVVNKIRPLKPVTYRPSDLVKVPKFNPYARIVRRQVSSAIVLLGNDMKAAGQGTLIVQSGYRSYSSQTTIHRAKVRALGKVHGEKLAARPGYSEHQTGLAVDFAARGVSTLQVSFAKTKAGVWLAANAYRYGFVLRYPAGKTAVTGYSFEPWHFRYVGVQTATAMHDQAVATMEEFYSLPSAPNYLN